MLVKACHFSVSLTAFPFHISDLQGTDVGM